MIKRLITLFAILFTALLVNAQIRTGAERTEAWIPKTAGHRTAVLANHTAIVGNEHIVDLMLRSGVNIVSIISPEHGFRGTADAGEKVANSIDKQTGLSVWSLYGSGSRKLSREQLQAFDMLIVDMQDVGLRFYTYYITMLDVIGQCATSNIKVLILDRPNPNGMYVDGPILDMQYRSGVGAIPIPVVHGLTMGEIATMAIGEGWIARADIEVIRCDGYTHSMRYTLPIAPSPNLRSQHAIYLYPSTCLFEGTVCSLGRGTDSPFEMYGHPEFAQTGFSFTPRSVAGAKNPPLKDQLCHGIDLCEKSDEQIISEGFNLEYIIDAYHRLNIGEKFFTPFFEKLVGVGYVRSMIIEGATADEIRHRWQAELEEFRILRKKYLLYND